MVVLKRLSKAIQDGNTIRAVIRSTGSNQVGIHSCQMNAVADSYRECLTGYLDCPAAINSNEPRPMFSSSVTDEAESQDELAGPESWIENLVSQVKFSRAFHSLVEQRHTISAYVFWTSEQPSCRE